MAAQILIDSNITDEENNNKNLQQDIDKYCNQIDIIQNMFLQSKKVFDFIFSDVINEADITNGKQIGQIDDQNMKLALKNDLNYQTEEFDEKKYNLFFQQRIYFLSQHNQFKYELQFVQQVFLNYFRFYEDKIFLFGDADIDIADDFYQIIEKILKKKTTIATFNELLKKIKSETALGQYFDAKYLKKQTDLLKKSIKDQLKANNQNYMIYQIAKFNNPDTINQYFGIKDDERTKKGTLCAFPVIGRDPNGSYNIIDQQNVDFQNFINQNIDLFYKNGFVDQNKLNKIKQESENAALKLETVTSLNTNAISNLVNKLINFATLETKLTKQIEYHEKGKGSAITNYIKDIFVGGFGGFLIFMLIQYQIGDNSSEKQKKKSKDVQEETENEEEEEEQNKKDGFVASYRKYKSKSNKRK